MANEGRAGQVGAVEGRAGEVGAAVPAEAAGGASGLFSTAQQLGGAVGVALLGTVFFGWVTSGHTFAAATTRTGRMQWARSCCAHCCPCCSRERQSPMRR
jgi:hypothetical protein